MKPEIIKAFLAVAAFSAIHFQPSASFAQGSLTPPPGAPSPVMKTLDQVEARLPLVPGAPGVVYTNGGYVIVQSGSYYLTGNITVGPDSDGISLHAPSVSLDLNGFAITGTGDNYGIGNSEEFGGHGNRIFNGMIQNCKYGIYLNGQFVIDSINVQNCAVTGIAVFGENSVVSRCVIRGCPTGIMGDSLIVADCSVTGCISATVARGINIGSGSVSRCRVSYVGAPMAYGIVNENGPVTDSEVANINSSGAGICQGIAATQVSGCRIDNVYTTTGTATGIHANGHGTISDCRIGLIKGASGARGIYTDFRLNIRNSEINDVIGVGASAYGIRSTVEGTVISECVISSVTNTVGAQSCYGIYSSGGIVDRCTVVRVKTYGIYAGSDTIVTGCKVAGVKDVSSGVGIYVGGTGNRIENNNVTGCYKGFENGAGTAMIVRNHASGNTTSYVNLPAGFVFSGYASMAASSNPFANVDL